MAHTKQQVYRRAYPTDDGGEVIETEVDHDSTDTAASTLQSFVMTVVGIINGLLVIRFILSALAANPSNVFASFIYTLTEPIVSPFQGLFGIVDTTIDGTNARIEPETLMAMVVVLLVGWAISKMIALGKTYPEEV